MKRLVAVFCFMFLVSVVPFIQGAEPTKNVVYLDKDKEVLGIADKIKPCRKDASRVDITMTDEKGNKIKIYGANNEKIKTVAIEVKDIPADIKTSKKYSIDINDKVIYEAVTLEEVK